MSNQNPFLIPIKHEYCFVFQKFVIQSDEVRKIAKGEKCTYPEQYDDLLTSLKDGH